MDKVNFSHTHTQEYYCTIKKKGNLAIYNSMDELEGFMLSAVSQTKKDKKLYGLTYT